MSKLSRTSARSGCAAAAVERRERLARRVRDRAEAPAGLDGVVDEGERLDRRVRAGPPGLWFAADVVDGCEIGPGAPVDAAELAPWLVDVLGAVILDDLDRALPTGDIAGVVLDQLPKRVLSVAVGRPDGVLELPLVLPPSLHERVDLCVQRVDLLLGVAGRVRLRQLVGLIGQCLHFRLQVLELLCGCGSLRGELRLVAFEVRLDLGQDLHAPGDVLLALRPAGRRRPVLSPSQVAAGLAGIGGTTRDEGQSAKSDEGNGADTGALLELHGLVIGAGGRVPQSHPCGTPRVLAPQPPSRWHRGIGIRRSGSSSSEADDRRAALVDSWCIARVTGL